MNPSTSSTPTLSDPVAPSVLHLWSATPTPFLPDGSLDEASFEPLLKQHQALGITGLFLAGSCGEGAYLSNAQRAALVRKLRKLSGEAYFLSIQVADASAARVVEQLPALEESGVDAILIAMPKFQAPYSRDALRRYYVTILDAIRIPSGLYVLPAPANVAVDPELWLELAAHPNVRYIKDSSRNLCLRESFGSLKSQRPDLTLLSGDEFDVSTFAEAGYDGMMLGTGILVGKMMQEVLLLSQAGRMEEASAMQVRSNTFLYDLFRPDLSLWPSGLKYALVKLGIFSSESGYLTQTLTPQDRNRIDQALEREREWIR